MNMSNTSKKPLKTIILGAGIAGLSAGYIFKKNNFEFETYETSSVAGGLARSFKWHGINCDMGPHRLFSENEQTLNQIRQIVEYDTVIRKSKILLNNKWLDDPVSARQLLYKFSPVISCKLVFSYLKANILSKNKKNNHFAAFVINRFGEELFRLFFQPYAEKLFGLPVNKISATWGEKKIRITGLKDSIKKNTKLYFNRFYYPKKGGYGALVNELYDQTKDHVQLNTELIGLSYPGSLKGYCCQFRNKDGSEFTQYCEILISTLPLPVLTRFLGHNTDLAYRSAKLVYLHINKSKVMPQQWVYIVDSKYIINRVAEFKNFSSDFESNNTTVICAEITCIDKFSKDRVLEELEMFGLIHKDEILDYLVRDISHAYPLYDLDYEEKIASAQRFLNRFDNLHIVGRQAQFEHQDIDEIFQSANNVANLISKQNLERHTQASQILTA